MGKTMKVAVAVGLALAALLVPGMPAQAVTGNTLLEWCQQPDLGLCYGYRLGFLDADTLAKADGLARIECPPFGATASQVRDIVVKELLSVPEQRQAGAASLVAVALYKEWPCAQK
jgi:Rap1a immunity proteins